MQKGIAASTFLLAALLLCSHASFAAENWPDSVDQYVENVRRSVATIDLEGYAAVVRNPAGAFLVDVRDEGEFKAGHIPGETNLSRGRLEFQIWRALGYPSYVDLNQKIYVHCGSGARAVLAARQLKDIGFTNVTAVVMSIPEWTKKGYPFVKD